MGVPARNSAVPSASPNTVFVLATTRIGTTGRKTEAAPNTGPSLRTTGFPSTAAASISRKLMHDVPSVSVTIPALRHLARSAYGYAMEQVRQTSILWPIFPLLPLLSPLFCPALTPTARPNAPDVPLSRLSHIRLIGAVICRAWILCAFFSLHSNSTLLAFAFF